MYGSSALARPFPGVSLLIPPAIVAQLGKLDVKLRPPATPLTFTCGTSRIAGPFGPFPGTVVQNYERASLLFVSYNASTPDSRLDKGSSRPLRSIQPKKTARLYTTEQTCAYASTSIQYASLCG
jgi:hypothetical protein